MKTEKKRDIIKIVKRQDSQDTSKTYNQQKERLLFKIYKICIQTNKKNRDNSTEKYQET